MGHVNTGMNHSRTTTGINHRRTTRDMPVPTRYQFRTSDASTLVRASVTCMETAVNVPLV